MKTDARVRYTKKVLRESLLYFLQFKSITEISVKEVCERAEINRATFYKHYKDCCDLLEQICSREMAQQLHRALDSCLTEQEKQVVVLRYGLSGEPPKRQREVAQITGISRSYVSRIEKKALEKLRRALDG